MAADFSPKHGFHGCAAGQSRTAGLFLPSAYLTALKQHCCFSKGNNACGNNFWGEKDFRPLPGPSRSGKCGHGQVKLSSSC